MKTPFSFRLRGLLLAGLMAAFGSPASAQTAVQMLPNLKPLPAWNISLVYNSTTGAQTLRFATTSWNKGTGRLQLEAGTVDTGNGKQQVYQRIFNSDGTSSLKFAGWFTWHSGHNHFHFDDYALYTLQPVNAPGGSSRTGSKTTFCVMDTTAVDLSLAGAPQSAVFNTCGNVIQGMSVGWGDTYGANLVGQELDFTGNADGIYQLVITVDPKLVISESDETDNVSCVLLNIVKPSTVTVLDSSGSCSTSTVTAVDPNVVRMGYGNSVTITGTGFTPGVSVSFEGGSGPRPTVSGAVVVNPEGTAVTAHVTVPVKKQLGRDPVWDVRVGSAVRPRAFTVTR